MSAITWIVGNMHVWTSDKEVVREMYRRCRRGPLKASTYREVRRKIYREALEAHHDNQNLCKRFHL